MPAHGMSFAAGARVISADASSINLYTLAGSPTVAGVYAFVINGGVTINSDGTNPAVHTGSWPAGLKPKLTNNGNVYGKGGNANGGTGGDAIYMDSDLDLDNTGGNVFAGGGGGGQGSTGSWFSGSSSGGGGGGGQGSPGGSGGSAGAASGSGGAGSAGGAGNVSGAGSGGPGGSGSDVNGSGSGGTGGSGGTWGQPGDTGDAGSDGFLGGAGGATGYAVRKNAHTLTFLGGNNSAQVKGTVA